MGLRRLDREGIGAMFYDRESRLQGIAETPYLG